MTDGRANLEIYNRPDVAAYYGLLSYLTPCERYLFDLYIKTGTAILDLGVGGGRTTAYLAGRCSRYVGVDYASEMIRACRQKYPGLEFLVADASDLSGLESNSFDSIVCAFNGLDYVIPDERRDRCLEECRRVLKPGGILLFSSHNPRSILVRPFWNRERARKIAEKVGPTDGFEREAALVVLSLAAGARALFQATWRSIARILTRVPSRAFRRGEGYLFDSAHGGLMTHYWVPRRVIAQLERYRFRPLRILGDDYPHPSHEYVTDWYYYVFSKSNSAENGEACA
jgi:ubiquinone/menaquinone biosynthesis C-methylase UbiE